MNKDSRTPSEEPVVTTDFNARQIIRDVLTSSTMTDPGDIANEVERRIDDEHLRLALRQILRSVVREEITRNRMHSRHDEHPTETPQLAPVIAPKTTPAVAPAATSLASRRILQAPQPPARSAKVAGIRDWWSAELRKPYHVGEKRWLALGDCTFTDLMFVAAERRDQAARNAARAKSFTELANAVAAAGVARVRDLPAETLRAHLGGAAA